MFEFVEQETDTPALRVPCELAPWGEANVGGRSGLQMIDLGEPDQLRVLPASPVDEEWIREDPE